MRKKLKNNPLLVIFFTVFLDLIGFGILIPIIPVIFADPQSPSYLLPQAFSIGKAYILMGFIVAIFPICQFFTAPIFGQMSDKFGRKKLLIFALSGTCVSYVVFAFGVMTKNLPLIFLSRILNGLTGGNVSVAMAAIADVSKPENRAKNFGLIGAAFGLGSVFGPFIGGKFSDPTIVSWFNSSTPFLFAAFLSLLNVLFLIFLFPETNKQKRDGIKINWSQAVSNIVHVYGLKEFRPIFSTLFLFDVGFTFFATFVNVFLINRYSFTSGKIGDLFMYNGLWLVITQIFLIRKISKNFKDYQILKISFFIMGVSVMLYLFTKSSWQLLVIAPAFMASVGLARAFINSLISRSSGADIQGEVLGIASSVSFLGQVFPPILSGFIAAKLTAEAPLYVSSVVLVLAGIVFNIFYKPQKEKILSQ